MFTFFLFSFMHFVPRLLSESSSKWQLQMEVWTFLSFDNDLRAKIEKKRKESNGKISVFQIWSVYFGPPGSASEAVIISTIRIRILFHKQAKKLRKTLISTVLWLLYDFLSLKNDVNVPSKRNKHKNLEKKNYFLLASWRSLMKRAGSGAGSASGSVSQRCGSDDPDPHQDPYQNVTELEHCQISWFKEITMAFSILKLWKLQRLLVFKLRQFTMAFSFLKLWKLQWLLVFQNFAHYNGF